MKSKKISLFLGVAVLVISGNNAIAAQPVTCESLQTNPICWQGANIPTNYGPTSMFLETQSSSGFLIGLTGFSQCPGSENYMGNQCYWSDEIRSCENTPNGVTFTLSYSGTDDELKITASTTDGSALTASGTYSVASSQRDGNVTFSNASLTPIADYANCENNVYPPIQSKLLALK